MVDDDEVEEQDVEEVDADDEELQLAVYQQDSTKGGRKGGRKGKKTVV